MAWPPSLEQLTTDMRARTVAGQPPPELGDTAQLQQVLDAAVAYVQRVKDGEVNFAGDPLSPLPEPGADLVLGTLRLAGRWHTRRRSPDALIDMGQLGAARVPSIDADIQQLLGIGRYGPVVFG
ncbi:hypothetical protein [Micromonospora aurantiaca (nom. illeg.)]|uniref:hypothetical protein n=1 Tax=Micromonospora aurantiaca (nom. illeg.) TaxID=47850 RepID=UPI003F49EB44